MDKFIRNIYWLLVLLMPIFMQSCSKKDLLIKTTISLTNLYETQLDSGPVTFLTILQTYPTQHKCQVKEEYANLYICKKLNGDSIYVFEKCEKVSDLAFSPEHYMGMIEKKYLPDQSSKKVTVFVPKDFILTVNAKYIFAKMKYLTEY